MYLILVSGPRIWIDNPALANGRCVLEECLDVDFDPFDADRTINLMIMTISDALHVPLTKTQDVSKHEG